jgi:hypothetical protein
MAFVVARVGDGVESLQSRDGEPLIREGAQIMMLVAEFFGNFFKNNKEHIKTLWKLVETIISLFYHA